MKFSLSKKDQENLGRGYTPVGKSKKAMPKKAMPMKKGCSSPLASGPTYEPA